MNPANNLTRIGVISDTHGHLDAKAAVSLAGVDLILHAGDIDTPVVLRQLEQIAPVIAVRGNMDRGPWSSGLKSAEIITLGTPWIYLLHDQSHLDLDPASADVGLVIHGHTHRPTLETRGDVTYLNPGSATLPRGGYNPTVAIIHLSKIGEPHRIVFQELS